MEALDLQENTLFNLIKQQTDRNYTITDGISLHVNDQNEAKNQDLIKKHENSGFEWMKDPKALIEDSNNMQDI